jgi:hypothetical protein
MATNYTFIQPLPDVNYPARWSTGQLYTVEFELTLGATVVTGDTYTTPVGGLPSNGIRISEVSFNTVSLDTNATPTATISVGDAGLSTRFINAALAGNGSALAGNRYTVTINQAQVLTAGVVSAGYGYLYSDGTAPVLVCTVGGTLATAQTAGLIRLRVTYYCVEEN